jgi:hypothetical protein
MGEEIMKKTQPDYSSHPDAPKQPEVTLKRTDPERIASYIKSHWNESVEIEWPRKGEKKVKIPEDWDHGAGREFDAVVHFQNGILTTETISGRYIEMPDFIDWMCRQGFELYCGGKNISQEQAAFFLSTDIARYDRKPLVEIRRTKERGVPVSIQIFGTLRSEEMRDISRIGNDESGTDRNIYTERIRRMVSSYASLGTTALKRILGISPEAVSEGMSDDLFASGVTAEAYEAFRRSIGLWPDNAYRQLHSVGMTPLAAALFVTRADMTGVPLITRTFAFGGGLGGEEHNLNYIMHTDPDLKGFVFGDVGDHTAFPGINDIPPHYNRVNGGSNKHRVTVFLRGGESIRRYTEEILDYSGKQGRQVLEIIIGAARANKGTKEYAVGINGVDVLKGLPR